jgi:GAF domain-containing protein/anti-sigma regulatory factor (Ser/Thr protein kinase)
MLFRTQPRAFTNKQRQAMRSFAAQAAIAIENLHLFEDTQRRLLEMADLTWVSNRISASRDLAGIAATITGAAAKAVNVPLAAVLLAQPNGRCEPVPGGQFGLHDDGRGHLPAQGHVGAEALEAGAPQAVADAEQEGRAGDALVRWLGARSVLCVPVTGHQGLRSLFVVGDHRPRVFRSHTVALVSNYANQAALALQSALLAREEEKHHAGLAKLYEVSQALASSLDLTETLNTVLNSAADLLEAPVCSVMLMDFEAGELVIKAARGFWPDDALYERIKPGSGLAGRAVQSGMALTSSDISRDGRFRFRERAREGGLRTAAAAPLVARGRTLGVISVYRKTDREFTEEEKRLLMSLANSAAVAIENANLYREAQEKAQFLSAMMSEINQRIRNTLQAIAGLLRMEMERPLAGSAQAALKRGIARIQSAAVVHELLRARELQFVDMKQVAERVFQLTSQSLTDECRAEVKITGARVMLPSQKATSAALILAELIDNSLRHGLADHASGRLAISLVEAGGNVVIQVKDNGPGLPASFDLDSNAGLGLKIVRGLVEQELGGVLEVDGREGLLVRARFPKSA